MLKGCKIRIYPTKEQEEILLIYCKYSHLMRNFLVAKFKDNLPKINCFGIKDYSEKQLVEDFGKTEILLHNRIVRGVLYNYKLSLERFYKKRGKPPKFHKFNPNKQSFYLPSQEMKVKNGKIILPSARNFSVKGKSKIIVDNKYIQKFNITKVKEPRYSYIKNKWYLTGSYEVEEPIKQNVSTIIGLDWGIKNFMTSSLGDFINYPKSVNREFKRINKLKSLKNKKIKNSKNYNKIILKLNKAYDRFEFLKKDFIEQTTTKLCKYTNIAVEDLTNVKIKMSNKSRRRLLQIAPLNRFNECLKWKCKKFGTDFYEVNPAYTSQICSCCGNKMGLFLKDRICNCSCGNTMDRDTNAAINIAAKVIRSSL